MNTEIRHKHITSTPGAHCFSWRRVRARSKRPEYHVARYGTSLYSVFTLSDAHAFATHTHLWAVRLWLSFIFLSGCVQDVCACASVCAHSRHANARVHACVCHVRTLKYEIVTVRTGKRTGTMVYARCSVTRLPVYPREQIQCQLGLTHERNSQRLMAEGRAGLCRGGLIYSV